MSIPEQVEVSPGSRDMALWRTYKADPTPENRSALLRQMGGVLQNQVNKWAGPVPAGVLMNQAKVLAAKAFDTYSPDKGAALATHVTNSLLPLSRTVYTHQNTARIPENLTMKINTYNTLVNEHKILTGREPTAQELRDKTGWTESEIRRVKDYNVRDLIESGSEVSGRFYDNAQWEGIDESTLSGIWSELSPEDRRIFEHSTGYNGKRVLGIAEMARELGMTVSQVNYRKSLVKKQVEQFMRRPSVSRKYGK